MKVKSRMMATLVVILMLVSFSTTSMLMGQQEAKGKVKKVKKKAGQEKPADKQAKKKEDSKKALEDFKKKMSLVDKVKPIDADLKAGFESITANDSEAMLTYISSDLMEGRDTASRGYNLAAQFSAALFKMWGLKPAGDMPKSMHNHRFFQRKGKQKKPKRSYLQNIAFREILESKSSLTVTSRKGSSTKIRSFSTDMDFVRYTNDNGSFEAPVVFVGYGVSEPSLKYDEYKKLDVKGKIVVFISGLPGGKDPKSPFKEDKIKSKYTPKGFSRMFVSPKIKNAEKRGAIAIIKIAADVSKRGDVHDSQLRNQKVNDERTIYPSGRKNITAYKDFEYPWKTIPQVRISRKLGNYLMKQVGRNLDKVQKSLETTGKPVSFALPGVYLKVESTVKDKLVQCRNVLGILEGSDPELKKEYIVIGGHLDHLGKRGDYIFNGSDDNGSGSVGVLQLAKAFATNPVKPKRSIIFALWTGEEKGFLGSRHFVLYPKIPLKQIKTYINMDMVSRSYTMDIIKNNARFMKMKVTKEIAKLLKPKDFLTVSTFNDQRLLDVMRECNQYVGFQLMVTESKRGMGGSDFAPFGYFKIPWISYHAAFTDEYHQPSDSIGTADFSYMERIIKLVWLSAFKVANR